MQEDCAKLLLNSSWHLKQSPTVAAALSYNCKLLRGAKRWFAAPLMLQQNRAAALHSVMQDS